MDLQQLYDRKRDVVTNMTDLRHKFEEDGNWGAEREQEFNTLNEKLKGIDASIKTAELQEEAEKKTAQNFDTGSDKDEKSVNQKYYEEVFPRLIQVGRPELLTDEERKVFNQYHEENSQQRAALGTGSGGGGNLVPTELMTEIIHTMQMYGFPRDIARILPTNAGEDMDWPTEDNRSKKGVLVSENPGSDVSENSPTYGQKTIKAFTYSSGEIPISRQLLQDSAINLVQEIRDRIAEYLGRITGEHFTTGDGNSKPEGVVTASTEGHVSANSNSIIVDDWYDLESSLDPAYRANATFMFNDAILTSLKKLQIGSSDARPIWQPGLAQGEPNTIIGYPYRINQEMTGSIAAGNKTVLFGNFQKFIIRDVQAMTIQRLEELRALKNQTSWVAFSRHDCKLVDTTAVKHMRQTNT